MRGWMTQEALQKWIVENYVVSDGRNGTPEAFPDNCDNGGQ